MNKLLEGDWFTSARYTCILYTHTGYTHHARIVMVLIMITKIAGRWMGLLMITGIAGRWMVLIMMTGIAGRWRVLIMMTGIL